MHDVERRPAFVTLLVGVVKTLGRFGDDPRGDPRRDARRRALGRAHEMAEVTPLDVLHGEDVAFVALVRELVHLYDVRVVQARGELSLVDEHRTKAT